MKKDIGKIRKFTKEIANLYHSNENEDNELRPSCTYLFGGGDLHVYCSNFIEHQHGDYRENGIAFDGTYGRWLGEAMGKLREYGWIFSISKDICICPTCANKHGLILK